MNVEVISVGTELLMGEVVNTNAVYLMKFCRELGFNVYYQSTVGDNPQRLKESIELAFQRGADTVITTGGIGPTNDDLTKQISAEVFGLSMIYCQAEAEKVEKKVSFLTGQKNIAKSNYQQAYYAQGAYILENEVGTANGCVIEKDSKRIVNLPGPPREMKYVVDHSLRPYFTAMTDSRLFTREFVILWTGESQLADELAPLFNQQEDVTIALYAGEGYVRIRLATKKSSETKANLLLDIWQKKLTDILGDRLKPISSLDTMWIKQLPEFALDLGNCEFLSDFFYKEYFTDKIREDASNNVHLFLRKAAMGEILTIEANFHGLHRSVEIPSLKGAIYAIGKNKQRIFSFLKSLSEEINHGH